MCWIEKDIKISDVKSLLKDGYEIEVESPDGFVPITLFVDKGMWEEYILTTSAGAKIRCNENHLFETDKGWRCAKDCTNKSINVLSKTGFVSAKVKKTGEIIPIIDINVDHENHRYYTNGVSSHNTGVGKSLFMCHHAAACLSQNNNVLYITCEMAEERIAERIDANLLDINLDDLRELPYEVYHKKIKSNTSSITGKLIIKEYPTASANSNHFKALVNELWMKKKFKPDIIFIDYLNICASSRMKAGAVNSYTYIKAIAEELRGLAVEFNVPIVSATQVNRQGFCLALDTKVVANQQEINISEVKIGDKIKSNTGDNIVMDIFPIIKKKMYKISTESGKQIICSKEHVFPTINGDISIKNGLKIGDDLLIDES